MLSFPENNDSKSISTTLSFNITPSAAERITKLREMEAAESGKQNAMLRLAVYAGGCSGFKYHLEMTDEFTAGSGDYDDTVIEFNGTNLLVVDNTTLKMLNGGTIDFVDEVSGSYFRIQNPNAAGSCGCGKSFS